MKFSRNPATGILEAYTDEGIYVGEMATTNVNAELTAQDGGPGSGNFGHKGRPGLVGGSGPGGGKGSGKLYRHEKQGVGFFGTRRDWLNGLEGEEQHKAARFLAKKKKDMKDAFNKEKTVKDLYLKGYLTLDEYEQKQKELGVYELTEESPVEEFIMKQGKPDDVNDFLDSLKQARGWDDNKGEYVKKNLSAEEQKVFNYLSDKDSSDKSYRELEAKAMGINITPEIPDEILIESGVKERPKKEGANYDWYKEKRSHTYSQVEGRMGYVIDNPLYGVQWGGDKTDKFAETNRAFLSYVKYDSLTKNKCIQALRAMDDLRELAGTEYDEKNRYWYGAGLKFTGEHWRRLNQDEKKRLLEIAKTFNDRIDKLEDATSKDFYDVEWNMMHDMSFRSNEEKNIVRDYVVLMDKLITGEVPSEVNPVEERKKKEQEEKKAKEEEKARKKAEWEKQRDSEQKDFESSPAFTRKKTALDTVRNTPSSKIKEMTRGEVRSFVLSVTREDGHFNTDPNVPDEFYRAAAMAIRDVIDKYPFLAGEIGGFGDDYRDGVAGCSIYAGYSDPKGVKRSEVIFNHKYFSNPVEVRATRIAKEEEKWWSKSDLDLPEGYADICHELGHVLANWLNRVTSADGFVKKVVGHNFFDRKVLCDTEISPMLKKNVLKKFGIKTTDFDKIVEEVSKYGAASSENKLANQTKTQSKAEEFFAECFAELMCSKKPRRVAVEFGRQLDEFIRKHHITENLTATTSSTKPRTTDKDG